MLFIPAGCTSKLQVCDIVINQPFKAAMRKTAQEYFTLQVFEWIQSGKDPVEFRFETDLSKLKKPFCVFLSDAVKHMENQHDLIIKGFSKAGIYFWGTDSELGPLHKKAVEDNKNGELFKYHGKKKTFCAAAGALEGKEKGKPGTQSTKKKDKAENEEEDEEEEEKISETEILLSDVDEVLTDVSDLLAEGDVDPKKMKELKAVLKGAQKVLAKLTK